VNLFYGDTTLYDNSLSDKDWLESEIIKQRADLEYLKKTVNIQKRMVGKVHNLLQ